MDIYYMTDRADGVCKYIGMAEDMEEGFFAGPQDSYALLPSVLEVGYVKAGPRKKAEKLLRNLIGLYQPELNRSKDILPEPGFTGELEWIYYGEFDYLAPVKDANGLTIRRGPAKAGILALAALSGGLCARDVCISLCGSEAYFKKVIAGLKKKKEAEIVFGETPHRIHILRKGCEAIEPLIPGTVEKQKKNSMSMANAQRKEDLSKTLYVCQMAGLELYPPRKPAVIDSTTGQFVKPDGIGVAYVPSEVRTAIREGTSGSRYTALILKGEKAFLLYHMGDRNMKFNESIERRATAVLSTYTGLNKVQLVVLGKSRMLEIILKNGEAKSAMHGNGSLERITPDMDLYFIPTDTYALAATHLRLLLGDRSMIRKLEARMREEDSLECICTLPLHLSALGRLTKVSGSVSVLCSLAQEPFIKKICHEAVTHPVKNEKLLQLVPEP